jgi:hypothetical protein
MGIQESASSKSFALAITLSALASLSGQSALAASDSAFNGASTVPQTPQGASPSVLQSSGSGLSGSSAGATPPSTASVSANVGTLNAEPAPQAGSPVLGRSRQSALLDTADVKGQVGTAANEELKKGWDTVQTACASAVKFYASDLKVAAQMAVAASDRLDHYHSGVGATSHDRPHPGVACHIDTSGSRAISVPLPFAPDKHVSDGDGPDETTYNRLNNLVTQSATTDMSKEANYDCWHLPMSGALRDGKKTLTKYTASLNDMREKGVACFDALKDVAIKTIVRKIDVNLAEGKLIAGMTALDRDRIQKGETRLDKATLLLISQKLAPALLPALHAVAEEGSRRVTLKQINLGSEVIIGIGAQMSAVLGKDLKDMKLMVAANHDETQSLLQTNGAAEVIPQELGSGNSAAALLGGALNSDAAKMALAGLSGGARAPGADRVLSDSGNGFSGASPVAAPSAAPSPSSGILAAAGAQGPTGSAGSAKSPSVAPTSAAQEQDVFIQAFSAAEQAWRDKGMQPDLTAVMATASEALARFRDQRSVDSSPVVAAAPRL